MGNVGEREGCSEGRRRRRVDVSSEAGGGGERELEGGAREGEDGLSAREKIGARGGVDLVDLGGGEEVAGLTSILLHTVR